MSYRAIIVDDEDWVRYLLRRLIRWREVGFEIVGEARDGDEGLRACRLFRPHLVLTDIRMPDKDGIAFFTELLSHDPDVKVIVVTGYADFSYAQSAIAAGVFDYVLKPVNRGAINDIMFRARAALDRTHEIHRRESVMTREIMKLQEAIAGDAVHPKDEEASAHPAVSRAIRFMKEHFAEKISLDAIAVNSFTNPRYLCEIFHRENGRGVMQWLTDFRIERARALLREPLFTVHEIASLVGFTDPHYFARVFRRVTGVTPSEFREQDPS